MTIKNGDVNPLAVFNIQRLTYCPPHFQKVKFDMKTDERFVADWIHENINGRFYLGKSTSDGDSSNLSECAAFENHAEASLFALSLSLINVRKFLT